MQQLKGACKIKLVLGSKESSMPRMTDKCMKYQHYTYTTRLFFYQIRAPKIYRMEHRS